MTEARVTLVGKPGCHLCDVAAEVVARVCDQTGTDWQTVSIFDDLTLMDKYAEFIPVILVDGQPVAHYHVDAGLLTTLLTAQ